MKIDFRVRDKRALDKIEKKCIIKLQTKEAAQDGCYLNWLSERNKKLFHTWTASFLL